MKEISPAVYTVLKILNNHAYEAYLVGGALRDVLLGKKASDYDITTSADPNAIRMVFSDHRLYDIGKKHGTVGVLIDDETIEITPFRLEAEYSDHRHPDKVSFTDSLLEDLKRRDFTINALCMDRNDEIKDFFGGIDDLNNRIIRCIGDPEVRFNEDGLRILRAVRFMSQLNFMIEEETSAKIISCKDLLRYISAERKREELLKTLRYPAAFKALEPYIEVYRTFMNIDAPDRQINNFSNPLFALACLTHNCDNDFHALKYSNEECELLKNLIQASHIDPDDDHQFISILSSIYQEQILQYLEEYHQKDFKERFSKLNRYMIMLNDLKISGSEIENCGFSSTQISQVKDILLDLIHHQQLENDPEALHKQVQEIIL